MASHPASFVLVNLIALDDDLRNKPCLLELRLLVLVQLMS